MADIFISYANEDRPRVEQIAKTLEKQGWSVWWDRTIPPGRTFDEVIEEALDSARCVIVIWSKASVASNWVKTEASEGARRGILIPVLIEDVQIPLEFRRVQAADLMNWETEKGHPGFLSLQNAISEVAGPPTERDKSVPDTKLPESNLEQQPEVTTKESETFQPDPSNLKAVERESLITGPKTPRKKRLTFGIGALALILILSFIGWFLFLKPALYTINASSGLNGSISPSGEVEVTHGDSQTFTITPKSGYHIEDVKVDGESVEPKPKYSFNDVSGDRTIKASFALNQYTITASSGLNGSISPSGEVEVTHGDSKTFTITPKSGYHIENVEVDNSSLEQTESSYTFKNVIRNHKISASFNKKSIEPPSVEVWTSPNFRDRSEKFKLGEYKDLKNWQNQIDSIKIPDGVVVTAWSHPNFKQKKYGPYRGQKDIPKVYGQNDWDSMKVELSKDVPPFVEIFAWPEHPYDKKCASVFEGNYPKLDSLNTENWKNEIDSIKIPKGLKVTGWSYPDYQGTKYGPYQGPSDILRVKDQNDWDSMKIERIE